MRLNIQPSIEGTTQNNAVNKTRIIITMVVIYSILASAILLVFTNKKNTNQQKHLSLITEQYERAYQTIYSQHEQLSINLLSGLMIRFEIENLYQELLTADEAQKNKLRQVFHEQIRSRFLELRKEAPVQQLHFHLRNNESFLRLHMPNKYGDNLEEIRPSIAYVNREHKAINGYENGRGHGGYRFVFPITGTDSTHLGSLEISFGPEALTSNLMKQYVVFSNFFILKTDADAKTFPDAEKTIYSDSHFEGFYYDQNVLDALEDVSQFRIQARKPSTKISQIILKNVQSGQTTSFYDPDIGVVVTTIPVFSPITHKLTAFCTVRSQANFFSSQLRQFRIVCLVTLLLLASIFITFYLQYNQRKTLEIHSSNLEEQKNQLLLTQKTLQQERDMFMQGPVMVFIWENKENWPVTHVSKNVLDILGYKAEEFLDGSVPYISIIHEDDRLKVEHEVSDHSSPSVTRFFHEPYRLISRQGETVWVLDSTTMVRDAQGEILCYQGYLVDITKMVLMEKEIAESRDLLLANQKEEGQKRLESLKTMAGAIAHRFNNTMMTVGGNLDLLLHNLDSDSKEYSMASEAVQAARSASQVGSMMLSYLGQKTLKLEQSSLSSLLEKQEPSFTAELSPEVSFKIVSTPDPLNCFMDSMQITEVLSSIVTNAIDSLEGGPGKILISCGVSKLQKNALPLPFQNNNLADGQYFYCQVQDTGHGIEATNLPLVFEPFYTTRFVGRGLGLALTVGIMRSHGGAITIESTPGAGTTVRMLLPAVVIPVEEKPKASSLSANQTGQMSGTVLFVDDEKLVLDIGRRILERLGFTVQTASGGQGAVDLVKSQSGLFCAVVMDVSMPGMDGFAAMKEIRKSEPNLPVLLSSGYSEDDLGQDMDQENKPDAFLNKPFLMADIQIILEGLLP